MTLFDFWRQDGNQMLVMGAQLAAGCYKNQGDGVKSFGVFLYHVICVLLKAGGFNHTGSGYHRVTLMRKFRQGKEANMITRYSIMLFFFFDTGVRGSRVGRHTF